ncbi:MAG: beta-galactosidase, partial [bacterium]|nr:beta-galactosidase [bacterium]
RDRVNYWIYKLKQRGIYVYLGLRAYRTFKDGDGVPNAAQLGRAARPYAYFNPRLIELQKQYAEKLLITHTNPYTGLAYAQDPAVVMLELVNEDSLFSRPEKWPELVEPYRGEFQQKWNQWLLKKYGSTYNLRSAWTDSKGHCALGAKESLENNSVLLPNMSLENYDTAIKTDYSDALKSPARRSDAARFAADIQRSYFAELRDYLRKKGVKIPITAVVSGSVNLDTWTVAQELDFTAENAYYEHPQFEPGKMWTSAAYYENKNYLKSADEYSLMPWVTRYKWAGKPVVVREWSTCWPNSFRAGSILETAAYACLQDFDALLHFAYYSTNEITELSSFGMQADPTRWGLFGIAAKLFLQHDVKSAEKLVEIGYSKEDLFTYSNYLNSLNELAWFYRVQNRYIEPEYTRKSDLIIASGRSNNARYPGNRSIIYANTVYATALQNKLAEGEATITAQSKYRLSRVPITPMEFSFAGIGFESVKATKMNTRSAFKADEGTMAGYQPMGLDANRKVAYGFYDPKRENLILAESTPDDILKFAVDLIQRWYNIPITHTTLASGIYPSDTKELIRDTKEGRLLVDTDKTQVIQGSFAPDKVYKTSKMEVVSQSPFAVIVATSLDNQPLATAKKLLVKMVTIAENRGQKLEPASPPAMAGKFVLSASGSSPVQTFGKWSNTPTSISINGNKLIDIYLQNGVWELLCDFEKDQYYFFCDTPNTKVRVNSNAVQLRLVRYHYGVAPDDPEKVDRTFIYPGFAKYIELTGLKLK